MVKDAHYNRAKIFYNQGNFEDAKDEIKEVLDIDSNHQDAQKLLKTINRQESRGRRYLAWALVTVIAVLLIFSVFRSNTQNGTVERNRENETLQKPLTESIDYAKIGYDHLENEEYNEAIDALKKAISSDSSDEAMHNSLGIAYYSTQDYEAAIDAFKKGISLNPQLKHLHHNLGWAYFKVKELEDAKKAAEEALKIDPNYESARELLKVILKELIPPKLSIEQISLIEPSGNEFLDAGEKAHIKFTVRNSGGTASDITVYLKWDSMVGLKYDPQTISTLYQNKSKTIQIPIVAYQTIKGKKDRKVDIQLIEKNGNVLVSKVFYITTVPLLPKVVR